MTIDLYHSGGCMTCGGREAISTFLTRLSDKYGYTLNVHNTQIHSERMRAETYRNDFAQGHFYFPLVVINGVGKVTGYKPTEIENAIKESL